MRQSKHNHNSRSFVSFVLKMSVGPRHVRIITWAGTPFEWWYCYMLRRLCCSHGKLIVYYQTFNQKATVGPIWILPSHVISQLIKGLQENIFPRVIYYPIWNNKVGNIQRNTIPLSYFHMWDSKLNDYSQVNKNSEAKVF